MSLIQSVYAREILDSRGNPTVEVDVVTTRGFLGRACVPSGASTGAFEALELRDGDSNRYKGKGVLKAIANINKELGPELEGFDVTDQIRIDRALLELDGTENKSKYGANALLGISLACAKAGALETGQPIYRYIGGTGANKLPVPLMNIVNGGAHANNNVDVQEFMIAPVVGGSFSESLRAGSEIFQTLKNVLDEKGLSISVGDEGGFAPEIESNRSALELIMTAIEKAGYHAGENVFLALDVASTEFYKEGQYHWEGRAISPDELMDIYKDWQKDFPLVSIEDAFGEEDWDSWTRYTQDQGHRVQLVGDDLFVTNPKRLSRGIEQGAANALLVKVNQIGTLSETTEAVTLAQRHGFKTVMSHRSGETEDNLIADLAVGLHCQQIKTGSLCRSERVAKYNQLLRIEELLGESAEYWDQRAFQ